MALKISLRTILIFFIPFYILLGIGEIVYSLVYGINREILGMAFLIPPVLSILLWNKYVRSQETTRGSIAFNIKASFTIWLIISTLGVYFAYSNTSDYHLPWSFFFLISGASAVIAYQALRFSVPSKAHFIIIFEILCTGLLVSYSYQFLFPGPIGFDSTYHLGLVESIVKSGQILDYPGQYVDYPMYHILLVQIGGMTATSAKLSFTVLALCEISLLLLVFILVDRFVGRREALVAALIAPGILSIVTDSSPYASDSDSIPFLNSSNLQVRHESGDESDMENRRAHDSGYFSSMEYNQV
jgi:hypothetical protein